MNRLSGPDQTFLRCAKRKCNLPAIRHEKFCVHHADPIPWWVKSFAAGIILAYIVIFCVGIWGAITLVNWVTTK